MTKGDDFIFLYIPKTGSSFTLSAFSQINKSLKNYRYILKRKRLSVKNINSANIRDRFFNKNKNQHTTVSQVHKNDLSRSKLYSIIRNPFYAYISRYEYKHFANPNWKSDSRFKNLVSSNFPDFPNISFKDYIQLSKILAKDKLDNHIQVKPKIEIGPLSLQFIQMFAYEPKEVLSVIDSNFFNNNKIDEYFPEVSFLNNENLSQELHSTLIKLGYPKKLINFILNSKKKNVSVKKPYNTYLSKEIVNDIQKTEWFLFDFFSDRSDAWFKAINS
ncbi:sulfotransferase family 2 domain-containing protein [Psychroflexus sp. ALD_RP9]|uniref:sulfotransferase family 2 domain-containing protein n=1 Tax=Psychroflexus sp. ALD_RP9 TaxID=2777186 RepID=UPI001A8E1617|nr:sulfotransferase family 2 domain-containing protein [Psychroflexus sp. ALD_RP9]QSS96384.1 hypothetical protein IMZ30_07940 [Psychroflexus sp. ALD_RP9]